MTNYELWVIALLAVIALITACLAICLCKIHRRVNMIAFSLTTGTTPKNPGGGAKP